MFVFIIVGIIALVLIASEIEQSRYIFNLYKSKFRPKCCSNCKNREKHDYEEPCNHCDMNDLSEWEEMEV